MDYAQRTTKRTLYSFKARHGSWTVDLEAQQLSTGAVQLATKLTGPAYFMDRVDPLGVDSSDEYVLQQFITQRTDCQRLIESHGGGTLKID